MVTPKESERATCCAKIVTRTVGRNSLGVPTAASSWLVGSGGHLGDEDGGFVATLIGHTLEVTVAKFFPMETLLPVLVERSDPRLVKTPPLSVLVLMVGSSYHPFPRHKECL